MLRRPRFGLLSLLLSMQVAGVLLYLNITPRHYEDHFHAGGGAEFVCGWPRIAYQSQASFEGSRGWVTRVHPPGFDLGGVGINVVVCVSISLISLIAIEVSLRLIRGVRSVADQQDEPPSQSPSPSSEGG